MPVQSSAARRKAPTAQRNIGLFPIIPIAC